MLRAIWRKLRRKEKVPVPASTDILAQFRPHVLPPAYGNDIRQVSQQMMRNRNALINHFVTAGTGIEIGALHSPTPLPPGADVLYVDYLSVEDLRERYSELRDAPLVVPDIIDDGEKLEKVKRDDLDFVIANHFIEHCQNPILAIENMLSKLKPGGFIVLSVPDKRYTFDGPREITSFEHLLRDYEEGPEVSRVAHYRDYSEATAHINERTPQEQFDFVINNVADIHFHVWDHAAFFDFVGELARRLGFPIETVLYCRNGFENLCILQAQKHRPAGRRNFRPLAIPEPFPRVWLDEAEPEQGAVLIWRQASLWGSVFGFDAAGEPRWWVFEESAPGTPFQTRLNAVMGPALGGKWLPNALKFQADGDLSLDFGRIESPRLAIRGGESAGDMTLRAVDAGAGRPPGMWWDPEYQGQGVALSLGEKELWGRWFCFDRQGQPWWLSLRGDWDGNSGEARLLHLSRDGREGPDGGIRERAVGDVHLLRQGDALEFRYRVEGIEGALSLVPFRDDGYFQGP